MSFAYWFLVSCLCVPGPTDGKRKRAPQTHTLQRTLLLLLLEQDLLLLLFVRGGAAGVVTLHVELPRHELERDDFVMHQVVLVGRPLREATVAGNRKQTFRAGRGGVVWCDK